MYDLLKGLRVVEGAAFDGLHRRALREGRAPLDVALSGGTGEALGRQLPGRPPPKAPGRIGDPVPWEAVEEDEPVAPGVPPLRPWTRACRHAQISSSGEQRSPPLQGLGRQGRPAAILRLGVTSQQVSRSLGAGVFALVGDEGDLLD